MKQVRRVLSAKVGFAALLASLLLLAACGGSTGDDDSDGSDGAVDSADSADSAGAENTVVMELISFKPEVIEVSAGDTVTWTNEEAASAHTVTSGQVEQGSGGVTATPDDRFDSGNVAAGDTFEFTFDEPGTYAYYCAIHPATMTGEVRVAAN
ncbi:MAG: plastocyanin/azurin family copper-binding protein [Actinomycetota bacterium]